MKPVWERAGMGRSEYTKLSIKEKKKIIRKLNGTNFIMGVIKDATWYIQKKREERKGFRHLLEAFYSERAERHTIAGKYPNAGYLLGRDYR